MARLYLTCILFIYILHRSINGFLLDDNKKPITVGAFNIQYFGIRKMADPDVSKYIVEIVSKFDVILIQEVRDTQHVALDQLLTRLKNEDAFWTYISSNPVGRTTYKEKYVFFYKLNVIQVESTQLMPDPNDIYEREPFAMLVKYGSVSRTENRKVVLAGVHIKPGDAKVELKELPETIRKMQTLWPYADGVITMGDFNADCNYLTKVHRDSLELFNASLGFQSLIHDDVDTTVKDSDCAYDRIIVLGNLDVRDAKVDDFKTTLNLTQSLAEQISDHFPVQFKLY